MTCHRARPFSAFPMTFFFEKRSGNSVGDAVGDRERCSERGARDASTDLVGDEAAG
jgi:hypothetical protein